MSNPIYIQLHDALTQRQNELNRVADVLAKKAQQFSLYWTLSKVALITLGALAATKGAFDTLLQPDNKFNLIFFTVIGLLVAIITGLETTFRYEGKTIELKTLAAECHSAIRQIDTLWYQKVGFAETEVKINEAKSLLEILDNKLADIQVRATKIGLNLTLEIRHAGLNDLGIKVNIDPSKLKDPTSLS